MTIDSIVYINDDVEDVLTLAARLPGTDVQPLSQWQAKMHTVQACDVLIIDNDQNDLKASKGAVTLKAIRETQPERDVIYTSFQPSIVPEEVIRDKHVHVVKTDQLPAYLAKQFGLQLAEPAAQAQTEATTNLLITYNTVDGYAPGMYANGKLLIVSYHKDANILAKEVVEKHMKDIWGTFDFREDRDRIRSIFVYDGFNGGDKPGSLAQSIGHDARMLVHMLACRCEWERKQRLASSAYVTLSLVECGGEVSMGMIADILLGIKRPGVDYSRLPLTEAQILAGAEKFKV